MCARFLSLFSKSCHFWVIGCHSWLLWLEQRSLLNSVCTASAQQRCVLESWINSRLSVVVLWRIVKFVVARNNTVSCRHGWFGCVSSIVIHIVIAVVLHKLCTQLCLLFFPLLIEGLVVGAWLGGSAGQRRFSVHLRNHGLHFGLPTLLF